MQRYTHLYPQKSHENTKLETVLYKQNNCKVNRKSRQGAMRQKLSKNITELILFWSSTAVHGVYSLKNVCEASETLLEGTSFSFVNIYQLEIGSRFGMGPSQLWDPVWLRFVQPLCMPHSLFDFMCAPVAFRRPCLLGIIHPRSYTLYASSSIKFSMP